MNGLIFVGMLPPESHNPEERRFVEELAQYFSPIRRLRGIGVKRLRLRHLTSIPGRLHLPGANGNQVMIGSLKILPLRSLAYSMNVAWLRRQLLDTSDGHPERWILWTRFPSPELVDSMTGMGFREIVYEPIDRYAAAGDFSSSERRRIRAAEHRLIPMATVIAGSHSLAAEMTNALGGSHWLPFGHDAHGHRGGAGIPADLSRPRIAVVAEFDWRVDEELLHEIAGAEPSWQLVLVGPRRPNFGRSLENLRNVHWIGRIAPERVRPVIADCDVALIPYRLTDWTRACLPVKVFEYLAEGKPVVATPLPELDPFGDTVSIARPNQFPAAIRDAINADNATKADARRRAAMRFTLEDRARQAAELLQKQPVTTLSS